MQTKVATREAYDLFHRGTLAFSKVEENGIRVDTEYLDRTKSDLRNRIKDIQVELKEEEVWKVWRKRYGPKANLTSGEQLGTVLYEDMGYKVREVTETGKPKTDESNLERIGIPFTDKYVKMSRLAKVVNTFLAGIERETVNGYIHPMFNLNTARTYRSSSQKLNFQNLPIRDPEQGEFVRRCFIPRTGKRRIVEVDFSGIEVRISYCYHRDPVMKKYLLDKRSDMHRDMAAQIYKLEPEQVSKAARHTGKNMFVFPQFYGDYYISCARSMWEELDRLKIKLEGTDTLVKDHLREQGIRKLGKCDPRHDPVPGTFEHHLREVENDFWGRRFKVYEDWKQTWWKEYQRTGGFQMYTGFRVDGVYSRNDVINYPVQGAAFHCLLWCLIKMQAWIEKTGMKSRIVGQIHDSIVGDVPDTEVNAYLDKLYHLMTVELPKAWEWIIIPMEAEAEVTPLGGSWHEKKAWYPSDTGWTLKV